MGNKFHRKKKKKIKNAGDEFILEDYEIYDSTNYNRQTSIIHFDPNLIVFEVKSQPYEDYKVMLEEAKPELVSIATESGPHAEIALYCIDKGINCIIEKPMAMSIEDADQIIALAEERGVKVSACHQNRFNIAIQELRKALEAGRFGRLSHGSINVRRNRNRGYYNQAPWRGTWA